MRSLGAGQIVQPFRSIALEVAPDLIELLAPIAHYLTGAADIREIGGQLQQRELAAHSLVLGGHVVFRSGSIGCLGWRHH